MALRVGYEKLNAETGWKPTISWEEGVRRTIAWYAANRESWVGRVDWMHRSAAAGVSRRSSPAAAGFLGSFLVERLRERGDEVVVPRRAEYDLTRWDDAERLFDDARPEHRLPPRGRGRRDRREPREPRPLLVREPDHGRARARALAAARRREARRRRHRLRLPEVHADAVPRGRALERLPRGDERAVRRREEVGARRRRRPTASSTASTPSTCSRRTSTGRATTSTSRPRTSSRR